MYEEYFSLSGSPFRLNPDPRFFFGSAGHNKAMAYLHYGLKQAEGFIVITGPIGSGKTMVISQLLDQLRASNVVAAQLLTSNIEPAELLDHILSAFRIEAEGEGRTAKLEAFEDYLFDQLNRGRRVLLVMDEAQNLPFETLEELRMLSNIDYDGTPLFQVFLVGQPEFRETMQSDRLEQLRQRVIASYHLDNLSAEETREYILHRLSIAGWREDPEFTDAAFDAVYAETGGRPRRINTLCNRMMLACALDEKHKITGAIAEAAIAELRGEELANEKPPAPAARTESIRPTTPQKGEELKMTNEDNAPEKDAEDAVAPETGTSQESAVSVAGASVFDRLRAQRKSTGDSGASGFVEDADDDADDFGDEDVLEDESDDEVQPVAATLQDIAAAIAGADPDAPAAPKAPSNSLRSQMRQSIEKARDELKAAHASAARLRKSLGLMQRRRDERRSEILAGIAKAETTLHQLQEDLA